MTQVFFVLFWELAGVAAVAGAMGPAMLEGHGGAVRSRLELWNVEGRVFAW